MPATKLSPVEHDAKLDAPPCSWVEFKQPPGLSGPQLVEAQRVPPRPTHGDPNKRPWFPFFLVDDAPVSPEEALAQVKSGATVADPVKATADFERFAAEAYMPQTERARYEAVISEHWRNVRRDRAARAREAAGIGPDDSYVAGVPVLLDAKTVAAILGVSERSLDTDRELRQSIPAPVRIGGVLRWKAAALAQFMDNAV